MLAPCSAGNQSAKYYVSQVGRYLQVTDISFVIRVLLDTGTDYL